MDMAQINEFDDLLKNLADFFSIKHKKEITRREIFDALFLLLTDKRKLEWIGDLWDIKLSELEAKELLTNFDFETLNKIIEVDDSLFLNYFLYQKKVRIKSNGMIWIIHKNDIDPFPSIPHAHNLEQNIKLDLNNGNLYRNHKCLSKLNKKDLLDLRDKASKIYQGQLPPVKS